MWENLFGALWAAAKDIGSSLLNAIAESSGVDLSAHDPSSLFQTIADAINLWASVFPLASAFEILIGGYVAALCIRFIRFILGLIPTEHG
jgi:hypothetical protein